MKKHEEISQAESCWNKAGDDELLFVLLARDESSVAAVRAWISHRIATGKNRPDDWKIKSAEAWIAKAEAQQRKARFEAGLEESGNG